MIPEPGLMQVLTWPEFLMLLGVIILIGAAIWVFIEFVRIAWDMMRE